MREMRSVRILRWTAIAAGLAWLIVAAGCAGSFGKRKVGILRISEIAHVGDPRRQGSMELIVEGLDAEMVRPTQRALSRYEQAIRIDPGNPYAYMALARHYIAAGNPKRALEHLNRAESLLDPDGPLSPRIKPIMLGLRGNVLKEMGRQSEGILLLDHARRLAPEVWKDERLNAHEFR